MQQNWKEATLKTRRRLNRAGSIKKTYHLELKLSAPISFAAGDSVGILPQNCPHLVQNLLDQLRMTGKETITCKKTNKNFLLAKFLQHRVNLQKITKKMIQLLTEHSQEGCLATTQKNMDLLDTVTAYQLKQIDPQLFADQLLPQLPRFYSIASAPSVYPNEIHLTVAALEYEQNGVVKEGVATKFLCQILKEGDSLPLFIHPTKHFILPKNLTTPIVMIGPGTGVAPFRAFLQERTTQQESSRNWLFFGECNRAFDYYYQEDFEKWHHSNGLKLNLAFSRDQAEKIYVQDLLAKNSEELFGWIWDGAYVYVCGDAKKMAKAVTTTLQQILCQHLGKEKGTSYFTELKKSKRYLLDVY